MGPMNLANATEPSMCSGDVTFCQITLTACLFCVTGSFGLLMHVWFCCVRFNFFRTMLSDWLARKSLKLHTFVVNEMQNFNSINQTFFYSTNICMCITNGNIPKRFSSAVDIGVREL